MAATQDLQRAIMALKTATTKLANGHGKAEFVEKAQQQLRQELKCFWGESSPELIELRRRAKEAFQASDWQLVVAMLGGNNRRERRPKAKRESFCPNGRGRLSPFAGREPSEEDALAIRTRMCAFEMASGAGGQTVRRGSPVVGTRKPSASSKKT